MSTQGDETRRGDVVDAAVDRRRWIVYAVGLVGVYLIGVVVIVATHAQAHPQAGVLIIMFAPTAGALAARVWGEGEIRWGRPSWWIAAALAPATAALLAYVVGSWFGADVAHYDLLGRALTLAPFAIAVASVAAIGEEIGWRGFAWPLLRRRRSFLVSALIIGVTWWAYHLPLILLGWYGSVPGLLAFTVALAGMTLFTGVITDRSQSLWPSVVAHGAWNALVATGFAVNNDVSQASFVGSVGWVGEFGWLAALASLTTGAVATWWHLRGDTSVRADDEGMLSGTGSVPET